MIKIILTAWFCLLWLISFGQWWDTDWDYRVEVQVDADSMLVTESGTYLYYFALSEMPSEFWDNVKTGGADIRVTDDAHSQIPAWWCDVDAEADLTGALWFKGDANASADESFFIYYGNAAATEPSTSDTYGRDNVFSMMQGGWSLHEGRPASQSYPNLAGTDTGVLNLTTTQTDTGDEVAGKLESTALDHDYLSSDAEDGPNANTWKPTMPATFLAWANSKDYIGHIETQFISSKYASFTGYRVFYWCVLTSGALNYTAYNESASATSYSSSTTITTADNNWVMLATSIDGSGNAQHYQDGATLGTSGSGLPTTLETSPSNGSWNSVMVGALERSSTTPDGFFNGQLQYVFIADSAWSGDKIKSYFRNTNTPGTFFTVGTQETQGGGASRRLFNIN